MHDQAADEIVQGVGVIHVHVKVTTSDKELSNREVELGPTDRRQEILVLEGKASENNLNCSDRCFKHQSDVENSIPAPPFVVENDVGEVSKAKTTLKEIKLRFGDDGRTVPSEVLRLGEEALKVGRTNHKGVVLFVIAFLELTVHTFKGFQVGNDHGREGVRYANESLIESAPFISSVLKDIYLG